MSARAIRRLAWGAVLLVAMAAVYVEAREGGGMYEFNGYTTRHFRLKELVVPDRTGAPAVVYTAPEHWTHGLTDRDNHWIGDPDGDYLVQRTAAGLPMEGSGAVARRLLTEGFRQALSNRPIIGAVAVREDGTSTYLESTEQRELPDGPLLLRNMVRIWPVENTMAAIGFSVIVRAPLWGRPETTEIVDLFRQQLGRIHASVVPSVTETTPPTPAETAHGYRELRQARPFGFMEINLPRRWQEESAGDVVSYADPNRPEVEFSLGYHIVMRTRALDGPTYRKVDVGAWAATKHPGLMQRGWMISDATPDRSLIVVANRFVEQAEFDKPETRLLEAIIDEEVRRMRIAVPPESKPATFDLPRKR